MPLSVIWILSEEPLDWNILKYKEIPAVAEDGDDGDDGDDKEESEVSSSESCQGNVNVYESEDDVERECVWTWFLFFESASGRFEPATPA